MSSGSSLRPSSRLLTVFFSTWAIVSALCVMWSLATPISASPDEPSHMIKAASVVRGQFIGELTAEGNEVQVPQYIAYTHAQTCYAMNSTVSAGCISEVPGDPAKLVTGTTTAGLYNPVYYLLVGWPTLVFHDSTGVFAMRIVSGILSSLFIALSAAMISTWRRRTLPFTALAIAITPMVLFLGGSVNPNALEITATLAAFIGVLSVVTQPSTSLLVQRVAVVGLASVLAANTRGLSPLWLAVALLAPFILSNRTQLSELLRSRPVRITIGVVGAGVLFAVAWLGISNSLGAQAALPVDERPEVPYLGSSPIVGFALMLSKTVGHFAQMVGVMGWLDTPLPFEVYSIWVLFVGSLLMWAVSTQRAQSLRFTLALLLSLILLPALVQAAYISNGGWIWQGRYALPLLVILVVGMGAVLAEKFDALAQRTIRILVALVLVAWSLGQFFAFSTAIHRYAVGTDETWADLVRGSADWAPPGGIVPSLVIFGAILGLAATLSYRLIGRWLKEGAESATPSRPERSE